MSDFPHTPEYRLREAAATLAFIDRIEESINTGSKTAAKKHLGYVREFVESVRDERREGTAYHEGRN